MPYDTYRLYQVERAKSPAEVRHADEQAARVASAASSLFRGITRPWRAMRRPSPVTTRDLPAQPGKKYLTSSGCQSADCVLNASLAESSIGADNDC